METTSFSFGLQIDALSFGDDADAPVFDDDNRFWNFFVGTVDDGAVAWTFSNVGPSDAILTDGAFIGFRAQEFGAGLPALPLVAVPEPSGLFLLGFAVAIGNVRRRRTA